MMQRIKLSPGTQGALDEVAFGQQPVHGWYAYRLPSGYTFKVRPDEEGNPSPLPTFWFKKKIKGKNTVTFIPHDDQEPSLAGEKVRVMYMNTLQNGDTAQVPSGAHITMNENRCFVTWFQEETM